MEGINVVSLFNGMGCIWLALDEANIKVNKRYSSEIEKYPNQANDLLYPDTIQLGDVRNVKGYDLGFVDLLAGGSPCQSFSFAGKRKGMSTTDNVEILTLNHYLELKEQNFEFEGQSYLFWEYIRVLEELRVINPNIKFLLENVMMGSKWQKILTQAIGINPIQINSALVSAQNRNRLYWTNIASESFGLFGDLYCSIPQPKDKGILLKDVLETFETSDFETQEEFDTYMQKYFLSEKMLGYLNSRKANFNNGKINYKTENDIASCINASSGSIDISDNIIIDTNRKSRCFTAGGNSGGLHSQMDLVVHNMMPRSGNPKKGGTGHLTRSDGKTYCLDTGNTNAVEITCVAMRGRNPENPKSRVAGLPTEQQLESINDGKTNCLTSVQKDNLVMLNDNQKKKFDHNPNTDKAGCLTLAQGRAGSSDEYMDSVSKIAKIQGNIRRLTPRECGRLQTVPKDKLELLLSGGISDTQLYKMFGNGWTVDVIAHILTYYKK